VQTLTQIRDLLASRGLSPRKSLGQNFLIDHNLIRKLVEASAVGPGDVVLEVGPGTGTLTEELLERGCRMIAAEMDRGLAELLRERHGSNPNFSLIEGDCLDGKNAIAPALAAEITRVARGGSFSLVANLPYGAATPLIMILLADWPACRSLHVTIQKEVADRILAHPGTRDYGPLSVLAQATCESRLVAKLPPGCFWPPPDVTSAMVSLVRLTQPRSQHPRRLLDTAQRVFVQRRKQLGSVLGRDTPLPAGVSPTARAETLTVEQWVELDELLNRGTEARRHGGTE
jgi:16S rRNA (adenine1518-N6/adenine1519-N6)-dimethyltransferase